VDGAPGRGACGLFVVGLTGLDFRGRNLADADFTGALLVGAKFTGARLDNAVLFGRSAGG